MLLRHLVQLFSKVKGSAKVSITGVVGASGVTGYLPGKDQSWILTVPFDAWRVNIGPVKTGSLIVSRSVKWEEFDAFQACLKPETVVAIEVIDLLETDDENAEATLTAVLGSVSVDEELNELLMELTSPISHDDEQFGRFSCNRRLKWFRTEALWNSTKVDLVLSVDSHSDLADALEVARSLWAEVPKWTEQVRSCAIEKGLALKNDSWLDEEVELTSDEFLARMRLELILVYPDGTFEFSHNDGDLFWGHSIQISGSLSAGCTDFDIPG